MEFTYKWYADLIEKLKGKGYCFANYHTWKQHSKTVILRHDVDISLASAVDLAKVESDIFPGGGCKATYFVLVSTNFYNIFSKESKEYLSQITSYGGEIALHFDETQYDIKSENDLVEYIIREKNILQSVVKTPVCVVSMHRPSKQFLSSELKIENVINAYSREYFLDMKYISDSRRYWREDVDNIDFESYNRLCVLTHPVWYDKIEKSGIRQALYEQIVNALRDKWIFLKENISDFEAIFSVNELKMLMESIKRLDEHS